MNMIPISESLYNYLGCSSNRYLYRSGNQFFWTGPSGPMYWPLPRR